MPATTLPITLQQARRAKRWSQLELSLRVGVSQRHLSFVESGRAKPSRELLIAWLQALDAPLVVHNAAMLQAGFAPIYQARTLADPALAQANAALAQLLQAHDPMPAMVLDAQWNLRDTNRGGWWLASILVPWLKPGAEINMLDLLAHPEGFGKHMINLREVGPALLMQLRNDASMDPALTPKVDAVAALLSARFGAATVSAATTAPAPPVLATRFSTVHGELAFFSMFTTFGTPFDITLASLRVEHMFAADESTKRVLRAQVGP
jgi:transcriptional regulator with XRE-family HTH domain